jgi:hypothetical protein
MKINLNLILKSVVLITVGCAAACQSNQASGGNNVKPPANQTTATATPTENKNAAPANSNQPESNKVSTSEPASKISLTTPTEAYKAAYVARQKKDLETLKRVMSKDALEFFSVISEPGESIDKALLQMTETPQAPTDETRNEKIKGETATLEYPNAKGEWKTMDFVKENGEWKLTFPKGDSGSSNKPKNK